MILSLLGWLFGATLLLTQSNPLGLLVVFALAVVIKVFLT